MTSTLVTLRRHLVDRRKIICYGGKGGDGCIGYRKHALHKFIGPGYPAGGKGGFGGSIYVQAVSDGSVWSLRHLPGQLMADEGGFGRKKHVPGESGPKKILKVPPGVVITKFSLPDWKVMQKWDLESVDEPMVCVCEGGRGGAGNTMKDPHIAELGVSGEHVAVVLELKTIADVGLVGFPNAGKSTFLGAVSRAAPKIAPYPFTTLAPYVGRVVFKDGWHLTVADVPGLVEDAHLNCGLGHAFLKHLERTKALLYVLDGNSPTILHDLEVLQYEVGMYNDDMGKRTCAVVVNKCDKGEVPLRHSDELYRAIRANSDAEVQFVHAISAREGIGIGGALRKLRALVESNSSVKEPGDASDTTKVEA
eukprot:GEMP01041618.1.p1 GENE.GEMP01041618.1~~GEMP01041618.1.p1  ORF type:complete len:364 (+),score=64.22 GEMP01041618.1:59-1150(+)